MNEKRLAKIREIIPEESPFYPLYSGTPKLEDLFTIPDIAETEPIEFSKALRLYKGTTGWKGAQMNFHGKFTDTNLLSHVMNHSGNRINGDNPYKDGMRPKIIARTLLRIAKKMSNEEISKMRETGIDRGKDVDPGGRIAIVFYDSETGDLVLRNFDEYGGRHDGPAKRLDQAIRHLGNEEPLEWKLWYLSGILQDRFDYFTRKDDRMIKADTNRPLRKKELSIGGGTKLSVLLRKIARPLRLTPLYLVFPPDSQELKLSGDRILGQIEKVYNLNGHSRID